MAGVAIAGYAFNIFGNLSTTANLKVLSVACVHPSTLNVKVTNTGASAGTINGALPSPLSVTPVTVPANTMNQTISVTGGTFAAGQTITGSLVVSTGSTLPFTATCT